jgi:hypothetical protein
LGGRTRGQLGGGAGSVGREALGVKRGAGTGRSSHYEAIILCRRHLGRGCGTLAP